MEQLQQVRFTLNGTTLRHETLEGKAYLVAPMAMLTEGVHAGSNGPLYYPKSELGKTPAVWNYKPVVVYHPTQNGQGVTATLPEVIETRKVGIIMNARFDDKLRAEAWLDEPKLKQVDDRVLNALNKGEMVEVSTGLFTDNEAKEGEWNGEKYVAIARNYRPDHLAILPDKKGACAISDGAGLLQLNDACQDLLGSSEFEAVLQAEEATLLTYNRDWPAAKREKLAAADFAGPNQTFPIKTQADVKAAASLAHHAKDPAAVKRRIIAIAKRKGLRPPAAWTTTNAASHNTIRTAIGKALQGRVKTAHGGKTVTGDVHDVYDDFFISSEFNPETGEHKYYQQGYEMPAEGKYTGKDSDKAKLVGTPKEVKRHYEWRDLAGSFVANMPEELPPPNKHEIKQRFIEELKMNGYDTAAELEMLGRMPLERLAYLVQNTWSQAMNAPLVSNKWTDAARAAAAAGKHHHVFMKGGSIGSKNDSGKHGSYVSSHATAEEAQAKVKRMNKLLSPGEKKYYGIRYHHKTSDQITKNISGVNFVAQACAAPGGGSGAMGASTAPAGGSPTPGEKQFGQRKATGKRKKQPKPMTGLVKGGPGATATY